MTGVEIEINFANGVKETYKKYFLDAASTWMAYLTESPKLKILIDADVGTIDGVGKMLGWAGPTSAVMKGSHYLPNKGEMKFDKDDVDKMITSETFKSVVVHEMGHVLGIGTMWNHLVDFSCVSDPVYIGNKGILAYTELRGGVRNIPVPVANTGGDGTYGGHWRESVFDHELMTGYVEETGPMPISNLTLACLEDLGYKVKYTDPSTYKLPREPFSYRFSLRRYTVRLPRREALEYFRIGPGRGTYIENSAGISFPESKYRAYDETFGPKIKFPSIDADVAVSVRHIANHVHLVHLDSTDVTEADMFRPVVFDYMHFSVVMSAKRKLAIFTACNIDGARRTSVSKKRWSTDPRLPESLQKDDMLYRFEDPNSEFDRGHLVRRLDPGWGSVEEGIAATKATYYFTNAAPQHEGFNQDEWLALENLTLDKLIGDKKACVFTGCVFRDNDPVLITSRVPMRFWKVVYVEGEKKPTCWVLPQEIPDPFGEARGFVFANYEKSLDELYQMTGVKFS